MSRSDLLLVRKAIREGWAVSPLVREQVIESIVEIFDDPAIDARFQVAACYAVIMMVEDNNHQCRLASLRHEIRPARMWPTT